MIRALIETSLIDWDGKLSTVLFFDKCNFMCPFCQNWDLIKNPEKFPAIQWPEIEALLVSKDKWIDGVVLTGGEPLMYEPEVSAIARRIKELGFAVKIDTNGAYPDTLSALTTLKLVDYVAMDLKAPLDERYSVAAGRKVDTERIKRSIDILIEGNIDYEFRTTCVPGIIKENTIADMGVAIKNAKRWVLQQYVPENAYLEEYRNLEQLTESESNKLLVIAAKYVQNVRWRGRA
ncbi:MAG: anaerobic ribonucleoside-triphosphate reductase activating protein [candidate division WOR-3 bacterium]|nr:MAG: anaerobic ribonucleoside-triphosphate reductase activating protein [candidate division WOR-3 bacterium]